MILHEMHYEWLFVTRTIFDPEVFWVMMTAVMTFLLVVGTFVLARMSYLPLVRARQDDIATRRAALAERFREELIRPGAQKIFFLAAHGFLHFREDQTTGIGFFEIIQPNENIILQRMQEIYGHQRIVMTFEMDDQILAPLQEVAFYAEHGELELEDVVRVFGDHIDVCFANKEIVKYIAWIREKAKPDVYRRLEDLHTRVEAYAVREGLK